MERKAPDAAVTPPDARTRIRRATPDDARIAAGIVRTSLAAYGLPFEPQGRDADVATFGKGDEEMDDLVVEHDERVVGIVSMGPQGDPGVGWLSKLFVDPHARRQGHGRALLLAAHHAARARGYHLVRLRTRLVFREAIALYEAEGWTCETALQAASPDSLIYRRTP